MWGNGSRSGEGARPPEGRTEFGGNGAVKSGEGSFQPEQLGGRSGRPNGSAEATEAVMHLAGSGHQSPKTSKELRWTQNLPSGTEPLLPYRMPPERGPPNSKASKVRHWSRGRPKVS